MDVLVKLTVPNFVYHFYKEASKNISGSSAEKLMADALSAYASLLSKDVAQVRESVLTELMEEGSHDFGNSSTSRSR